MQRYFENTKIHIAPPAPGVAVYTPDTGTAARPRLQIYWYHPNHLGTGTLITGSGGNPHQFFLNLPYGETMVELGGYQYHNPYKFNGKELDEETGLYYYGARYYDPKISLWLSVDPLAEKYPGVSPFAYTYDNPVRFMDPTGMEGETWDDDYKLNKKTGEIELIRKTDDNFDRLFATDEEGNIIKNKYLKINKKNSKSTTILSDLINNEIPHLMSTGQDTPPIDTKQNFAASRNKDLVFRLFKFVSQNSKVEWSVAKLYNIYFISTYHMDDLSPGIILGKSLFMNGYQLKGIIHSHPNEILNFSDQQDSLEGDYNVSLWFYKKYKLKGPYLVYFPRENKTVKLRGRFNVKIYNGLKTF